MTDTGHGKSCPYHRALFQLYLLFLLLVTPFLILHIRIIYSPLVLYRNINCAFRIPLADSSQSFSDTNVSFLFYVFVVQQL